MEATRWTVEHLTFDLEDLPIARRRRGRRRDLGRIGPDHEARLTVRWGQRALDRLKATVVGDPVLSVSDDHADYFIRNARRWRYAVRAVVGGRPRLGDRLMTLGPIPDVIVYDPAGPEVEA